MAVTFLINFPLMQVIVIAFATVFGLTEDEAIGDGGWLFGSEGVGDFGGVGV